MPTRILIVGAGGREHALAWKLSAEPGVNEVFVTPGSDGIAALPRVRRLADVPPVDGPSVVAAARAIAAELVVIGPETSLAAGVADALTAAGTAVFGPSVAAARIESSKAYCHEIAAAAGVSMARAGAFQQRGPGRAFARELHEGGARVVVKADGLAAGKGVRVCDDLDEALDAVDAAVADGPIVVEERLEGPEASLIALTDGRDVLALPLARDHKRLADGDTGPNTGGMGAISPLPDLPDESIADLLARFHRPILAELARRCSPFRGALYAGLIVTDRGPVLLECNARFGDPETQAILPRLATPLGPLLLAAAKGRLAAAARSLDCVGDRLLTIPGASVAMVLASAGYPEAPRTGDPITGLDAAEATGALIFHAGTARDPDSGPARDLDAGPGAYRTAGGRVLTVVGRGVDLDDARSQASAAADLISFPGVQRRHDIGRPPLAVSAVLAGGRAGTRG
ncbi:MAG: phosphoribosylamine--glycine ligase [Chloroflexi bacterium]|nr:phosphoribosylamine--glycine ligase [Chloroflexota bacterium]